MSARIDGIDISHWQGGALDFAKAKRAGVRFVYHKATEGTDYRDPLHDRRRTEVAQAGVLFGAYHFARPAKSGGKAQAQHFLAVAKPRRGDMRPVLDLEDTGGKGTAALTGWVRDFVAEVRRVTGEAPIIYTNFHLDDHCGCPRWAARYSNAMAAPKVARPWDRWTIWQFSNGVYGQPSSVPGIGPCDINTLNTTSPAVLVESLRLGGRPAPVAKPKPRRPLGPTRITVARALAKPLLATLDAAVRNGRTGVVADVTHEIRRQVNRLPAR